MVSALADEYSRRILLRTIDHAYSVEELSHSENVPISTAYRRVNELKESGLLTVEQTIVTSDGKKYEKFRSAFKSIHIDLSGAAIVMDADLNEDVATRLSRLWAAMRA